jgi:hypothetical protein
LVFLFNSLVLWAYFLKPRLCFLYFGGTSGFCLLGFSKLPGFRSCSLCLYLRAAPLSPTAARSLGKPL